VRPATVIRPGLKRVRLAYYMFDWDDNILHMPTRIHLERRTRRGWAPCHVSTAEFARIRRDTVNYRPVQGDWDKAFVDFYDIGRRGNRTFLEDTKIALAPVVRGERKGAPSFERFRQALVEGRLFAIITARSHSARSIRRGVEYFIDNVLSPEEKRVMIANLRGFIDYFGGDASMSDRQVLRSYLDLNRYHGVSSPQFRKRMGIRFDGAESPEKAKQLAIRDFVEHTLSLIKPRRTGPVASGSPSLHVSIGFSDDDPHNVLSIAAYLRSELSRRFPGIKFVVYDASDSRRRKLRKTIIRRRATARVGTPAAAGARRATAP
jgi:hypothetical protein